MKKHLVSVFYETPAGKCYGYTGFVPHVIGDNGKAVFYPSSLFKTKFGFPLPAHSSITFL